MATEPRSGKGVSVITIGLNAATDLPLTLESVIAQDYPDLELLVVDGLSWDSTASVLRRYVDRIDRLVVCEDAGIYHAMNNAVDHATREYVIFMNAGDRFYRANAISRMISALDGDPDIFYGNHVYVRGREETFRRAAPFEVLADRLRAGDVDWAWQSLIPAHQATFTRAAVLRQLRYDTRLRISADHELLFRAWQHGYRVQYVDELVCHYFSGGFSMVMDDLTRLEGAFVYRQFSDHPTRVDGIFYPGGSPFYPYTKRTGVRLGGFHANAAGGSGNDSGAGADWIAKSGDILSPDCETIGLHLSGFNAIADQGLTIMRDDEPIGAAQIPMGHFRVEIAFERPLPAASVIGLRPDLVRRQFAHGPDVGLAVQSFRFHRAGEAMASVLPGARFEFRSGRRGEVLSLLGAGWSSLEATHVWGIGDQSDVWLKLRPDAGDLRLTVGGNPHVPRGEQRLDVLVNGAPAASVAINHGAVIAVQVPAPPGSWDGSIVNRITLRTDVSVAPSANSGDTRVLSACLWSLEVLPR